MDRILSIFKWLSASIFIFSSLALANLIFLTPVKMASAPAPTFLPSDIAGLRVWLDFSDPATVTKNGSNIVSAVTDKSSHAYSFAGSGSLLWVNAGLNGLDVLEWNATNSMLRATAGADLQQLSVALVAKPTVNQRYNLLIGSNVKPTGQLNLFEDFFNTPTTLGVFGLPSSSTANTGQDSFSTGAYSRVLWTYDVFGNSNGGPNLIYFNRALKGSGNIGSGTVYTNDLCIGFDAGSNGWFDFNGRMGEVIIYDHVLTLNDQILLDKYLHDKWGFADTPPDPDPVTFTPTYPQVRQVFQRTASNTGSIKVAGATAQGSTARARAVVRSGYSGTTTAWQPLVVSGGNVSGNITANSGYYDVEIEVYVSTYLLSTATVSRVGIGTTLLVAGQSNATDMYSPLDSTPPNDAVNARLIDSSGWARATDPMPVFDSTNLSSVWPALADLIFAQTTFPVGIINTAQSNTFVADWAVAGSYYPRIAAALAQLPIGPEFFLWMHGENDASVGTTQAAYRTALEAIIDRINTDAARTVRCGISITTHHYEATGAGVRAAQIDVGSYSGCFQGPDTDTLGTSYRYDDLHFNTTTGRAAHAGLWFTALAPFL